MLHSATSSDECLLLNQRFTERLAGVLPTKHDVVPPVRQVDDVQQR